MLLIVLKCLMMSLMILFGQFRWHQICCWNSVHIYQNELFDVPIHIENHENDFGDDCKDKEIQGEEQSSLEPYLDNKEINSLVSINCKAN